MSNMSDNLQDLVAEAIAKEVARLAIAKRLDVIAVEYQKLNGEHSEAAREASAASAKVANYIDQHAREESRNEQR